MISYIKFNNHPVLGNAEFDFRKKDGSIYKNILLIGENGSGKTSLLTCLNSAINNYNLGFIDTISYELEGKEFTIQRDKNDNKFYDFDGSFDLLTNKRIYNQQKSMVAKQGCVFSSTRTNFELNTRNYQNKEDVDNNSHFSDAKMDYSIVLNLFYNLQNLDYQEYAEVNKEFVKLSFDKFNSANSRVSRFKNAFNNFFDNIKLSRIDTSDLQNIRVFFEKYGKEIEIDNLSSGEKQIVFRGTTVLRNKTVMDDGVVLIDEPELSLHPKWQSKILRFYKDIFTKNYIQTTQIIVSSHSENIIIEAMRSRDDTMIVRMVSTNSCVTIKKIEEESVLPVVTYAEASYLTFGVLGIEYHAQLFGYLQNCLSMNVAQTDSYIVSNHNYCSGTHERLNSHNGTTYHSISSYIRNAFDHPYQKTWSYTESDIRESITLLRSIISELP